MFADDQVPPVNPLDNCNVLPLETEVAFPAAEIGGIAPMTKFELAPVFAKFVKLPANEFELISLIEIVELLVPPAMP